MEGFEVHVGNVIEWVKRAGWKDRRKRGKNQGDEEGCWVKSTGETMLCLSFQPHLDIE